jgi:hypothetical protein
MATTRLNNLSRWALALSVLAGPALTSTALATSTIEHICETQMVSSQGVEWSYRFKILSTLGTEGGPDIRRGSATLDFAGYDPKTGLDLGFFFEVNLTYSGAGASYLAYEMPSSVHGLWVNFYPGSNLEDSILIFHNISESETLVSKDFFCYTNEVG